MEELENNQPAPKVERISLAELRAEAAKLNEQENKYLQEQKEFEEKLKLKKKHDDEQFEEEFEMFINSFNALSLEEQKRILDNVN